jgi:hypothetical protein
MKTGFNLQIMTTQLTCCSRAKRTISRKLIYRGYGNTVPVAKILDTADYNSVYGLVSQAVIQNTATTDQDMLIELDKIRKNAATAKTLVTTYTYQPGIGIASETDLKAIQRIMNTILPAV